MDKRNDQLRLGGSFQHQNTGVSVTQSWLRQCNDALTNVTKTSQFDDDEKLIYQDCVYYNLKKSLRFGMMGSRLANQSRGGNGITDTKKPTL
ncbi:hypothetical protein GCM10022296_04850 [Secundilactobacillus similis DSM 23365 = JCM 2765]